jgi:putative membrane protein
MFKSKRFSEADLGRIHEAVLKAEAKISGEIVPVFVERSGNYKVATYRGGITGMMLFFLFVIVVDRFYPSLAVYDPVLIFLITVLGTVFGMLLPHYVPAVKRALLSKDHIEKITRLRAESAFLQEEVFNTRYRTGIMLFVSFFEHEVIVLSDRGISKVVDQKEWEKIVRMITSGIAAGNVIGGMESAIHRCGEILLEHGFHKATDDTNELSDNLRVD